MMGMFFIWCCIKFVFQRNVYNMALFKVCILFVNHNFKWPPPEDRVLTYDHIENDSLSSLPGERNHVYENLYLCRIHFFYCLYPFQYTRGSKLDLHTKCWIFIYNSDYDCFFPSESLWIFLYMYMIIWIVFF